MTFPVLVEPVNGRFAASVLGAPAVRVEAPTRDEALSLIKDTLTQRVRQGELVFLDVETGGATGLIGRFAADPTLQEICEEAYRLRDAELAP